MNRNLLGAISVNPLDIITDDSPFMQPVDKRRIANHSNDDFVQLSSPGPAVTLGTEIQERVRT